jgi:DNA-binding transcriptional LysR family regulator
MDISQVDLNLLGALEALLEERSVTLAGRRLRLSQPAVSNALGRLRELFSDELLVRHGSRMVPTPRALALLPEVRAVLAKVRQILAPLSPFEPAAASERFTLLATDFIEMVVLPGLAARVHRAAPLLTLDVRPFGEIPLQEGLASGAIDLVLGVFPEVPPGCHIQKLFSEGFLCAVRRGHPALSRGPLTLPQYAALPHLLVAPRRSSPGAVDTLLEKHGLSRHVAMYVAHFLVAPLVVAKSDLVVTLPTRAARLLAPQHDLVLLDPPLPLAEFTVSALWHERTHDSPAHRWLRAQVSEGFAS